ncbi:universal stress protein [Bacillus sp. FJAT-49736]|uniref:universal stress protein n=1 Tax=Bacillus sp. FJAT-49736 TaxID=2833582 RepID=UPI001BC90C38|nr:universal stress protein [Bacillus sp. FJAT-49736]MBS4175597.1 universal stress protein [Bacillus sp. FJAT-49736]
MYKHILVGFDDSQDSMKALERAAQIYSVNSDCKITVVHVIQQHTNELTFDHYHLNYPIGPRPDGGVYPARMILREDELPHNVPEHIHDPNEDVMGHARVFLNHRNVTAEYKTLDGKPSIDLCEFALDHQVDLIIVGNSGKGLLKKLVEGSVSETIMKNAEMDVLVVK